MGLLIDRDTKEALIKVVAIIERLEKLLLQYKIEVRLEPKEEK